MIRIQDLRIQDLKNALRTRISELHKRLRTAYPYFVLLFS
jgi:hypothetical protein